MALDANVHDDEPEAAMPEDGDEKGSDSHDSECREERWQLPHSCDEDFHQALKRCGWIDPGSSTGSDEMPSDSGKTGPEPLSASAASSLQQLHTLATELRSHFDDDDTSPDEPIARALLRSLGTFPWQAAEGRPLAAWASGFQFARSLIVPFLGDRSAFTSALQLCCQMRYDTRFREAQGFTDGAGWQALAAAVKGFENEPQLVDAALRWAAKLTRLAPDSVAAILKPDAETLRTDANWSSVAFFKDIVLPVITGDVFVPEAVPAACQLLSAAVRQSCGATPVAAECAAAALLRGLTFWSDASSSGSSKKFAVSAGEPATSAASAQPEAPFALNAGASGATFMEATASSGSPDYAARRSVDASVAASAMLCCADTVADLLRQCGPPTQVEPSTGSLAALLPACVPALRELLATAGYSVVAADGAGVAADEGAAAEAVAEAGLGAGCGAGAGASPSLRTAASMADAAKASGGSSTFLSGDTAVSQFCSAAASTADALTADRALAKAKRLIDVIHSWCRFSHDYLASRSIAAHATAAGNLVHALLEAGAGPLIACLSVRGDDATQLCACAALRVMARRRALWSTISFADIASLRSVALRILACGSGTTDSAACISMCKLLAALLRDSAAFRSVIARPGAVVLGTIVAAPGAATSLASSCPRHCNLKGLRPLATEVDGEPLALTLLRRMACWVTRLLPSAEDESACGAAASGPPSRAEQYRCTCPPESDDDDDDPEMRMYGTSKAVREATNYVAAMSRLAAQLLVALREAHIASTISARSHSAPAPVQSSQWWKVSLSMVVSLGHWFRRAQPSWLASWQHSRRRSAAIARLWVALFNLDSGSNTSATGLAGAASLSRSPESVGVSYEDCRCILQCLDAGMPGMEEENHTEGYR